MKIIKRLFCAHRFEFVRNLYGDQINSWGGKRSLWVCFACEKLQARDSLHQHNMPTEQSRQSNKE